MDSISIAYIPTDSRAKVASLLKTQGVVRFFPLKSQASGSRWSVRRQTGHCPGGIEEPEKDMAVFDTLLLDPGTIEWAQPPPLAKG
jgi:hypothetical protein